MSEYVVVCESQHDEDITLFLVDSRVTQGSFWTRTLRHGDVLIYSNRYAARAKASSLRFNNPPCDHFGRGPTYQRWAGRG